MNRIIVSLLIILVIISVITPAILAQSKINQKWQTVVEDNQSLIKEGELTTKEELRAHFSLGVGYANIGKIDLAKKEFDLLDDQIEDNARKEFVNHYQEKLNNHPQDLIALNQLAFAHYANHNYKSSLKLFKQIVKQDPNNIWSYNYLATVYSELEKHQKAEDILHQSLAIEKNKYTHFLLGAVNYKQGNIFKALYYVGKSGDAASTFRD
ncbi:MAG: tetratricopeptide repeat protein [Bacillota bacterium]